MLKIRIGYKGINNIPKNNLLRVNQFFTTTFQVLENQDYFILRYLLLQVLGGGTEVFFDGLYKCISYNYSHKDTPKIYADNITL